MNILTHEKIDRDLCGSALVLEDGYSRVELKTAQNMAVDDFGLVHGGFVFGLADYAAMIAVNHPNVVLGAADVKFLKPVKIDETLIAEATVQERSGKKHIVSVTVKKDGETVFEGTFTCFVLKEHVLC